MSCHDARELFTPLLDDALEHDARQSLEAHLAGCADCRRELDAFRRTVGLVRGAPPIHAPAGFAERVLAATRPPGPPGRAARRAWFRVPATAAAIVLLSTLAVLVYQRTPEQHDRIAPGMERRAPDSATRRPVSPDAVAERDAIVPDETTKRARQSTPSSPPSEPGTSALDGDRAPRPQAATEERRAVSEAPTRRESTESMADVGVLPARLVVGAEDGVDDAVDAALRAAGAEPLARRREGGATVVELRVPATRYPALVEALGRLGRLEAPAPPAAGGALRVVLTIAR